MSLTGDSTPQVIAHRAWAHATRLALLTEQTIVNVAGVSGQAETLAR